MNDRLSSSDALHVEAQQSLAADDTPTWHPTVIERTIAGGVIALAVRILHSLLISGTAPLHDTRQSFETFHAFYNALSRYHEFPLWFSQMRYGVTSQFQLLLGVSIPKVLAAIVGILMGSTNSLRLFYLGTDIELFIFVFGAFLLGTTLYKSRTAVALLCLSCLLSTFLLWQIYFDFLLIAWVPLTLYLFRRFAAEADARALWSAGIVLLMSLIGNITYLAPAYLFLGLFFAVFTMREFGALRHPLKFGNRVSQNWRRHSGINVALLALLLIAVVSYVLTIVHAFDYLYISSPGRLADGSVSLEGFLTYGYDHSFSKLLELVFAVPTNPDARLFPGYVSLALAGFAIVCARRRAMAAFAWAGLLFVLLSLADATIVPTLIYKYLPAASRLRHIGLLLPVSRLMIFCLAGFGLDELIRNIHIKGSESKSLSRILLAITALLLMAALFISFRSDFSIPYSVQWPGKFTDPQNLHWISFLAGSIVIVGLLRFNWAGGSRQAPVAAMIVLATILELSSYQFFLYRNDAVQDPSNFQHLADLGRARLTLWREVEVLPKKIPLERWLRERPGALYGTEDLLLDINRCFPDFLRLDFHNLHVAQLASIVNGSSEATGYALDNPYLNASVMKVRQLIGCTNPTDGSSMEAGKLAVLPQIVEFSFATDMAVEGVEVVVDDEHPERAPASLTVFGSADNAAWVTLFTTPSAFNPRESVASRSWWFKNRTAYKRYRVAFEPQLSGPGDVAVKAIFLKTDAPMIRLVSDVQIVNSQDDAKRAIARTYGPGSGVSQPAAVVIEAAPDKSGAQIPSGNTDSPESISFVSSSYNRLQVNTEVGPGGKWLIYSDGWHPGWEARVDGIPQPIRRADLAFKGVWLPAGSHRVSFEFHNPIVWGAFVSLMAVTTVFLLGLLIYLIAASQNEFRA